MKLRERATTAWTIVLCKSDFWPDDVIMGVFYFEHGELNPWQDGMRYCLFSSREQAREHAKRFKDTKTRIAKVLVSIKEVR